MKYSLLALLLFGAGAAQAQIPSSYLPPVPSGQVGRPAAKLSGRASGVALADPYVNHMEYIWDEAKGTWHLPPANIQVERDAKDRISRVTSIDSLTGVPRVRSVITHDFNGVPDQIEVIGQAMENGQWVNVSRRQSTPNAKTTAGFYYSDNDFSENWKNGAWEPWIKVASTLDEHSNPVAAVVTLWQNDNVVRLENWSVVYTYDASNRVMQMVATRRNGTEQDPSEELKVSYTYTGAATSYTDRTDYITYKSNGVVTAETSLQIHQEVDAQGRLLLREQRDWNKATQSWTALNRTVKSYDAGTTTLEYLQRKDGMLMATDRVVEKTDTKGNVAERLVYTHAATDWALANGSQRFVRRYNAQNQLLQEVMQTNSEQAPSVFTNATMNTFMNATALAGAAPKELAGTIALYPNPAGSHASLQLAGLRGSEPVQVEVFNSVGQRVQYRQVVPTGGVGACLLPVQELRSGVYTVRISNNDGVSTRRLVRQ